jgi:hypothetical protein
MCRADYTACRAVQEEIVRALSSIGLRPDWRLAGRRPQPADTFAEQLARVGQSMKAVALVKQRMPIGLDERRLIERLVDWGMVDRERREHEREASPLRRPEPAVATPARRPMPSPVQTRRPPQAPPMPAVPLVIHLAGAAAHG